MKHFFKKRISLTLTLVLFVFEVMCVSFIVVGTIFGLLHHFGIISLFGDLSANTDIGNMRPLFALIPILGLCTLLGTTLAAFLSKTMLKPIRSVITATHEVAGGNFDVRVDLKGISELEELSASFNKMAQELSSIETLRSDFVNDFSHEFKTPIVSIRGFAKLLKVENLNEDERKEYIEIIIQESERLANLSTNVLNLSKLENLEIVSAKTAFQLDEQIRRAIVLMEPKWSKKELSLSVDMDNVIFTGSEDLTQQIWVNLLDNAIKFCYRGGNINIKLTNIEHHIVFSIQDDGCGMDESMQAHIFDKFYQGDASHTKSGNGVGLTLVKRIVDLCGGNIDVQSEAGKGTTFKVMLPV